MGGFTSVRTVSTSNVGVSCRKFHCIFSRILVEIVLLRIVSEISDFSRVIAYLQNDMGQVLEARSNNVASKILGSGLTSFFPLPSVIYIFSLFYLSQRDLDFTVDIDFKGELSEMSECLHYKMRQMDSQEKVTDKNKTLMMSLMPAIHSHPSFLLSVSHTPSDFYLCVVLPKEACVRNSRI